MFEFNFRDERYMPFEGAGAISSWKVELPSGFRQFDYQTISDVIIHISYTAQQDDSLRVKVEENNGAIATALKSTPSRAALQPAPGIPERPEPAVAQPAEHVADAEHHPELPAVLRRQRRRPGHQREVAAEDRRVENGGEFRRVDRRQQHFGLFGRSEYGRALVRATRAPLSPAGCSQTTRSSSPMPGNLAPAASPSGATAAIDDTSLLDVMLYVEYQLTMS